MEKITLNPLDMTAAEILQSAANRMAERVSTHNLGHAKTLRRMAMDLEKTPPTIGEMDVVEAFLLQTAAKQLERVAANQTHAAILNSIAQELDDKIHAE